MLLYIVKGKRRNGVCAQCSSGIQPSVPDLHCKSSLGSLNQIRLAAASTANLDLSLSSLAFNPGDARHWLSIENRSSSSSSNSTPFSSLHTWFFPLSALFSDNLPPPSKVSCGLFFFLFFKGEKIKVLSSYFFPSTEELFNPVLTTLVQFAL